MLDQDTKRKIDAARDILVGIVPDPKAQVNQITIALMYKFMDDMDRASAQAGGKASFLAGDFSQYSWAKLMDKRLSSAARMDLYVRAIGEMPKNPGIPQLFRDIFKEAFLPFRNARTLNLFLTEIDGFDYDHSENLGNAFEYLLSIMGAQGDAGQFRTPRHIIDFMVEVVSPQKNESILDPACGTAGFLISAYKYIFRQKPALTPQEKTKLTKNIVGYDISPDMVKLALVNMFLHRFVAPKIHEYDALTSEERWGHDFDVVLANPPFMTPKGGIEPHTQFRIPANRAEVLFVDYIAEHLTLKGRAGIVVPEGIIFQSANAYKNLRKALVEEWGLYAVASLPNGVFNPYSGVKTSVLFINRDLAKRTDKILFVKAENDGFDLGAQRRPIEKNDLPACLAALRLWQKNQTIAKNCNVGFAVEKEKIAEGGEYNLTAERYRETEIYANVKWEMAKLGDVCSIVKDAPPQYKGKKPYYETGGVKNDKAHTYKLVEYATRPGRANLYPQPGDVGFAKMKNTNKAVFIAESKTGAIYSTGFAFLRCKKDKMLPDFLYFYLSSNNFQQSKNTLAVDGIMGGIRTSDILTIRVPLPPLSVQKEIAAEIEQWQKIIDGAKQVTENWKPQVRIASEWPKVALEKILNYEQPTNYLVASKNYKDEHPTPVLTAGKTFLLGHTDEKNGIFPKEKLPVIIFDDFTTASKFVDFPFKVKSSAMKILKAKSNANIKFVFYMMQKIGFDATQHKRYWISQYSKIQIPLPPLSKQKEIVAAVEAEQKAVDGCKKLIAAMEKKIAAKIAEVWGE